MNQSVRQNSGIMVGSALLMLFYGWIVGMRGSSSSSFYNTTVTIVDATLKYGGLAILASGIMSYLGIRAGMMLGIAAAGLSGTIMILGAIYWFAVDRHIELLNFVMLLIGGFLLADVRAAWGIFGVSMGKAPRAPAARAVPPPEPIHPASIRSSVLPSADEPPPPEGYLAALAKEQEKPPTANYE